MSSSEEKESPNATKNDNLRSWNTEEVEKLIIHFFNHREVLVKEVREKNEKIFLNKLAGDLTSADFKPSAKQIRGKFRTIFLNAKPGTEKNKTKAGLSYEPPFKKGVFKYVRVFDNEHLF